MFPTVAETLGEVCSCGRELCWRQLGLKPRKPYLLHILWSVRILFQQTSYVCLHLNWPTFLSNFQQMWSFPTDFLGSPQCQSLWKSVQWEPRWQTERRTDIMKIKGASPDYSNAPKNNDLSKNSEVITCFSYSFLMALRYKKTCTAEERNPNICTILCHKCMFITSHCELTGGLPDEIGNETGQINSLTTITNTPKTLQNCVWNQEVW